ncbi:hypothetical protein OC834_001910 [Tilletia horrida]|nr:hypothetical protein OC834_001910 [Tilletia horrida]
MKTFHSTSTTTLLLLALVALRASGQPVPPSSPEVRADNASPRDALNTVRPSTLLTSEVIRGGVGPVRGPTWPAEGYEEVLPAGHGMILPRSSDSTRALVEGRGNNVDPFSRRSVISVLMKNKKLALGGAALVGLLQSVLRRDDADEHLVHAPAAALLHSRDLAAAPAPAPAAQPASADTVSPGSLVFIAAPDAWSTKMGSASRAVVAGERTSFPAMTPLPSGAQPAMISPQPLGEQAQATTLGFPSLLLHLLLHSPVATKKRPHCPSSGTAEVHHYYYDSWRSPKLSEAAAAAQLQPEDLPCRRAELEVEAVVAAVIKLCLISVSTKRAGPKSRW